VTVPPEFVLPPPTVGNPVSKGQVDMASGQLSATIETWAGQVLNFKTYLDSATDEILMAPPFGYSEDNIALLKSAFNDLSLLARIYQGDDVLAEARDLGAFSRRLAGLVL
jgi:hypothetical protein